MVAIAANSPLAVRPAPVGGDAHRAVPPGGRHAQPQRTTCARARRASASARAGSASRSLEIYQEDIARFRTLVGTGSRRGSDGQARRAARSRSSRRCACTTARSTAGTAPCYGVTDGKPHLRIENRVMPAGPSDARRGRERRVLVRHDGRARRARARTSRSRIDFDQAGANFYTAAREGLGAHFTWLDGEDVTARAARARHACCRSPRPGLRRQRRQRGRHQEVPRRRRRARAHGAHRRALAAVVVERAQGQGDPGRALQRAASRRRCSASRPAARSSEWERARLDEAEGRAARTTSRSIST